MPTAVVGSMPPAAAKSQKDTSSKPCHNCRRRRLRCDRTHPSCSKCESRGTECLGYGQLFLWTGAVATRGKLAGRTSSAALYQNKGTKRKRNDEPPEDSAPEVQAETCEEPETLYEDQDEDVTMVSNYDSQLVCVIPSVPSETSTPWTLVDPLFQDMTYSHRHYLAYFSSRLCLDLVGQDAPDRNPFRGIIPLTQAHPLLQQVIVAASAAHMCNQARPFVSATSFERAEAPTNLLMDALVAKQKALQLMPAALQSIQTIGGEVILASVLFLINIELIESGKHGWKPHLEGAGRIMNMITSLATHDETLRDYLMSDCFIYYILGSAISPSMPDPQTYFHSRQAQAVLEKAANSYFCCPPELLEILLLASQLSNLEGEDSMPDDMVTSAAVDLFQRAHMVDVLAWARKVREIPSLSNSSVGSRFRAGSVHRIATCLYTVQAVPALEEWLGDGVVEALIDNFYHSLDSIPPEDPNFKATAWPTFIFGSMAKTPEKQTWVVNRLKALADECPWGFLYTAMDTLQLLWGLEAEGKLTKGWLQTLRDPELNFLIV